MSVVNVSPEGSPNPLFVEAKVVSVGQKVIKFTINAGKTLTKAKLMRAQEQLGYPVKGYGTPINIRETRGPSTVITTWECYATLD